MMELFVLVMVMSTFEPGCFFRKISKPPLFFTARVLFLPHRTPVLDGTAEPIIPS